MFFFKDDNLQIEQPDKLITIDDDENGGPSSAFSLKQGDPKGWIWDTYRDMKLRVIQQDPKYRK